MLQKIVILLFSLNQVCFSQALSEQSFYQMKVPENSGEEILLITDRPFYSVNERIYFSAGYQFNYPMEHARWSNVIYVELIKWNGEKIAQAKSRLYENSASGYLTIPGTLLSGNYYLRAYTKWMRNFPAEDYSYSLVKVVNPFEDNIDQGPVQESEKALTRSEPEKGISTAGIECFTDKTTYKQREKVELSIRLDKQQFINSNFCVSVAKSAYADTSNDFMQIPAGISSQELTLRYLPEHRGISISGKVLHDTSSTSITATTLHLSTPQHWKYFTAYQTKESGLFTFTVPDFYGQYDFYIDALLEKGEQADILIDNDFCNRRINLPYFPFSLDSVERKIAMEMVVNMQLSNMYHAKNSTHINDSTSLPFYGKPTQVYYTREYITLPNLNEFFFELVNEVRIIEENKQSYLKLVRYSQYQNLNPLILLDNIAVSDVDEFLKIPLALIEKIELFDQPYMVTGRRYSGIICVSTKEKDFAGIELNKNSRFFSYKLLSEGNFVTPEYSSKDAARLTYRHNLLFWDPHIKLDQNYPNSLSFYTSDSKGEYMVSIRSINPKGNTPLIGTCKIVVE